MLTLQQFFSGQRDTVLVNRLVDLAKGFGRHVMAGKLSGEDFLSKLGIVKPFKLKTDFSGTWLINYPLCEFGKQPLRAASKQMNIVQGKDSVWISRKAPDQSGNEYTNTESLSFNGKPVDNKASRGERIKRSLLVNQIGDCDLTEFSELTYPNSQFEIEETITEKWKLAEGGKRLLVERFVLQNGGVAIVKLVYDKQQ